jgi:hypothetical protein
MQYWMRNSLFNIGNFAIFISGILIVNCILIHTSILFMELVVCSGQSSCLFSPCYCTVHDIDCILRYVQDKTCGFSGPCVIKWPHAD